jgi:serine/threonine-protein phosphatase 5
MQCKMQIHKLILLQILLEVKKLFMSQPSLVDVHIPDEAKFTVCGDIHGQFFDLMNIFELNGLPSTDNPYVSFWVL